MWGTLCRLTSTTFGRITVSSSKSSSPISAMVSQSPSQVFSGLRALSYLPKSSTLLSNEGWFNTAAAANPSSSSMFGGLCVVPSRGMKIKGKVRRRCKDCYLMFVDGVLHNFCKTHQRHKQMLKPMYFSNQRILTHATSHFKRPW